MTEVIKLINNVETLFNVFVPGALCVWAYSKLSLKKFEYQGYLALSISLGFVIKYCVDYIDHLLGSFVIVGFPIVIVYVAVGLASAIIFYKAKNAICIRKFFAKYLGIETGDNVWTRHIDFEGGTYILLHMDDGKYICGKIENADNDYIVLTDHATADSPDGVDMDDAVTNSIEETALCVPMSHVKRFEFMYCRLNTKVSKFVLQ